MKKRKGLAFLIAVMFAPMLIGANSCDLGDFGYGTVDLSTKQGQQALGTVVILSIIGPFSSPF